MWCAQASIRNFVVRIIMKLEKKIYFVPVFRKFARQTNSAVIPKYKWHKNFFFLAWSSVPEYSSFFYFTVGQHSSQSMREYRKFYAWSASFLKHKKSFLKKNYWKFFRVIFIYLFLFCELGTGKWETVPGYSNIHY